MSMDHSPPTLNDPLSHIGPQLALIAWSLAKLGVPPSGRWLRTFYMASGPLVCGSKKIGRLGSVWQDEKIVTSGILGPRILL